MNAKNDKIVRHNRIFIDECVYIVAFMVLFNMILGRRWDILDGDRIAVRDYGVWELNNVPMLSHNLEAYLFKRTNVSMADFVAFTEVAVHDQIRDNKVTHPEDA